MLARSGIPSSPHSAAIRFANGSAKYSGNPFDLLYSSYLPKLPYVPVEILRPKIAEHKNGSQNGLTAAYTDYKLGGERAK